MYVRRVRCFGRTVNNTKVKSLELCPPALTILSTLTTLTKILVFKVGHFVQ